METFSIPVIYKSSKTDIGKRILLPVEDLLYLRVIGKMILFYGFHRKEYQLHSVFGDWRVLLEGLNFNEVDRGTMVNVNNVEFLLSDLQQLHFGPRAEGVFCQIAGAHVPRFISQYPNIPVLKSKNR